MAWSKLEDTYHDDQKFRRLSEVLKLGERIGEERGMVLAQGFVSRLWSWASRHAPDGYLLDASVSTADIERVAGWSSAGGRLVAGMVAVGFLDQSTDGTQVVRIIHRFWERAESHKAAQRKKKEREAKPGVARQSQPPSDPGHGTVSLRGEERTERRGEEIAPDGAGNETRQPASRQREPLDLLVDHQPIPIPPEAVARSWNAYRDAKSAKGKPTPLIASEIDKINIRRVIGWTSPEEAPRILCAWVTMENANGTLSKNGWPLTWLAQDDNLERARSKAAEIQAIEEKKAETQAIFAAADAAG